MTNVYACVVYFLYSLRLTLLLKFERTLFQLTGCGEQVGEGKMVEKSGKEQAGVKDHIGYPGTPS